MTPILTAAAFHIPIITANTCSTEESLRGGQIWAHCRFMMINKKEGDPKTYFGFKNIFCYQMDHKTQTCLVRRAVLPQPWSNSTESIPGFCTSPLKANNRICPESHRLAGTCDTKYLDLSARETKHRPVHFRLWTQTARQK